MQLDPIYMRCSSFLVNADVAVARGGDCSER